MFFSFTLTSSTIDRKVIFKCIFDRCTDNARGGQRPNYSGLWPRCKSVVISLIRGRNLSGDPSVTSTTLPSKRVIQPRFFCHGFQAKLSEGGGAHRRPMHSENKVFERREEVNRKSTASEGLFLLLLFLLLSTANWSNSFKSLLLSEGRSDANHVTDRQWN